MTKLNNDKGENQSDVSASDNLSEADIKANEFVRDVVTKANGGFCIENLETGDTFKGIIFEKGDSKELRYCSGKNAEWESYSGPNMPTYLFDKALEFKGTDSSKVNVSALDKKDALLQKKEFLNNLTSGETSIGFGAKEETMVKKLK